MPDQYEAIKDSLREQHPEWSEKRIKTSASKIFIANGKGGNRSSRAKSLHSDSPQRETPKQRRQRQKSERPPTRKERRHAMY